MKNLFLALRKVLFWAHLVAGVVVGLIILVMAATGTLMSFERQITEAANGFKISVPADGKKLGAEELLAALKEAEPGAAPNSMTIRQEADAPVAFQYGREKTLFADPYTGKVLGEGAKKTRAFFQFVNGLHRWLALQGPAKDIGQGVTSAAALVFFLMILSGLYLWIPKRWTRKGIQVIATFQGGLKGRARDWNWHNVLGIWFAVPLLTISTTGIIMAYPWANRAMFALVGEQPPPPRGQEGDKPAATGGEGRSRRGGADAADASQAGEGRGHREGNRGAPDNGTARREGNGERREGGGRGPQAPAVWPDSTSGWNAAFLTAEGVSSGWQSIQFQMPRGMQGTFAISDSHRGRPDLKQNVTVDLATAAVVKVEKFDSQSLGRRLRMWVRWVHTGEAGGWAGQLLAALSTMAAVGLIWTGLALSWRRFARWRAAKKKAAV
jgi:uncharacterized iron-regulated membrane protein